MRNIHVSYLVPLSYLESIKTLGVWEQMHEGRVTLLSIRLLKNLGKRDFLQTEDWLVFSCLRIILW